MQTKTLSIRLNATENACLEDLITFLHQPSAAAVIRGLITGALKTPALKKHAPPTQRPPDEHRRPRRRPA